MKQPGSRERKAGIPKPKIGLPAPILTIIWIVLSGYLLYPNTPGTDTDFSRAFIKIDQYIQQFMKKTGTPGLAFSVTTPDKLLRISTYGLADRKTGKPVTPDTCFEIGSITKGFTAIALMQLMDHNRFDPHQSVTTYLPWFKVKTSYSPITCHHLLTHSAGIPANRDDLPPSLFMVWALRRQSAAYPPGQRFYYSNIGYQILSFILEELQGESYSQIIKKKIFDPLRMNSSEAEITHDNRHRLAVGYQNRYDDRPSPTSDSLVEAPWLEYDLGDGSIISTPGDMAAFLRMLLNRGMGPTKRLISEARFRMFSSPHIKMGGKWHYGYGMALSKINGHDCLAHGGATVGFSSLLLCDLDQGLGIAVMVNSPANTFPAARFILKSLQAALQGKEIPELPRPVNPFDIKNPGDYTGEFSGEHRQKLLFEKEGNNLIMVYDNQRLKMESRGNDTFYIDHPDFNRYLLRFSREGNTVTQATHGPDWYFNQHYQGDKQFVFPDRWKAYPGHYRTQNLFFGNFRILLRKGRLYMVTGDSAESQAGETELVEEEPGTFQVGTEKSPEVLRFDTVVQGKALRADFSGVNFYRIHLRRHSEK